MDKINKLIGCKNKFSNLKKNIYIYKTRYLSYWFTVYSDLSQLLHIGPFTMYMQLYISVIKSFFMLKIRCFIPYKLLRVRTSNESVYLLTNTLLTLSHWLYPEIHLCILL